MSKADDSTVRRPRAAGEGEIPPRALGISVLALAAAGAGTWLQAVGEVQYFGLLWVLALVPPFLLSYYRGWRGAAVALGAGMAVLTAAEVGGTLLSDGTGMGWWVYAGASCILIVVSLGSGYSTALFHRAGGELGRYADRLRALTDGVRAIHGTIDLGERLQEVASTTRRVLDASTAEIVVSPEGEELRRFRSGGDPAEARLGLFPARRVLTAPVRDEEEREIGRIEVTRSSDGARPFDESDEALLGQMAEIASVGVQNALLYRELRESEERYRTMADDVIDGSGVGVVILNPGGRVVWTNRAVEEFFGLRRGEAVGERHERLLRSRIEPLVEDGRAFRETVIEAREEGEERFRRECRVRASADGERPERWLEHLSSPIRSGLYAGGRIEHYTDVTDRKRAERALAHAAAHDALTGLPNRRLFLDRVQRLLEHAERDEDRRFALLFLDFDRFKRVNDSLGHQVGDRLLQAVGERLSECLRSADTVSRLAPEDRSAGEGAGAEESGTRDTVARLGGDEFAVLLHDIREDADAVRLSERIRRVLEEPFELDGHRVYASASVGIALGSRGYDTPEAMLRDADLAMYRAKEEGGTHRVFDASMHERLVEELDLETSLRGAVERDELHLEYQPIYRLESGAIAGFEALLRWTRPGQGAVPPSRFVPIAEKTGQMGEIGRWVMREASGALAGWTRRYAGAEGLFLSVNLSSRQLADEDLDREILGILEERGVAPSRLVLEITEHALAEAAEASRERLGTLRTHAIRVALDDFGTGHTSLWSLDRLPVDLLKIDQGLAGSGPGRAAVLEAVGKLAASLELAVVAESIETRDFLDDAARVGCELGQGFLLGRPVPEEGVDRLLEEEGGRDERRGLALIS